MIKSLIQKFSHHIFQSFHSKFTCLCTNLQFESYKVMDIMIIRIIIIVIHIILNFCMLHWSGIKGDKSGKIQGILMYCVSGNPVM